MKKILFITINSEIGGGPEHIYSIIRTIDRNKYDITVIAPENGTYFNKFREYAKVIPFDLRHNYLKNLFRIKKIINNERIEICHSHGMGAGVYSRPLKIICHDLKIVHTFHGIHYERRKPIIKKLIIIMEKLLGYLTDVSIAVSKKEEQEALKLKFQRKDKLRMLFNGIDLTRFDIKIDIDHKLKSISIVPGTYVVGNIARFDKEKGHFDLLTAFAEFHKTIQNSKLVLVGDGKLRTEIEERINNLNIKSDVILLGFRQDIPELLKCFDMFVSSSYKEGLPYSLIEAQSSGIPIVATKTTGNDEIIIDGYNGYLCEVANYMSLYKMMIKMFEYKDKEKFIKNGIEYAKKNFDIKSMVRELEGIYDTI